MSRKIKVYGGNIQVEKGGPYVATQQTRAIDSPSAARYIAAKVHHKEGKVNGGTPVIVEVYPIDDPAKLERFGVVVVTETKILARIKDR